MEKIRIILGLFCNLTHHSYECVQCLQRLGLRRLDHYGLMEKKREINGRRMEPVIQKTLGHIKGAHTIRLKQSVEYELMLAYSRYRQFIAVLQGLLDIVGSQPSIRMYA